MSSNPPPPSSTRRVRGAHDSRSATVRAAAAAPSRRQLSRWQREQQHLKLLYGAVAALVAVVAAIFAIGIFYDNVIRANQVVAQVGPDSITAAQLLAEVQPQARQINTQAKQQAQAGGDPSSVNDSAAQQIRGLPNSALNNLVDAHLIAQEAARRGISVSQSDIDNKVRETVASFNASVNATPSPTDAATPDATSAAQDSGTPAAATTPDQSTAAPTAPTTPTPVPTLDDSAYGPALQQLLDQNSLTESDMRTILERGLLMDQVQTAIGAEQVPATQPQVHARQIQVATSDTANNLLTQLQGGADFATLAQQNSTDSATSTNGGDMGWFTKGVQTQAIDDAVFPLQEGQLTGVVQDTAGFHILQVVETDPNRAVDPSTLTTLRQKAFTTWLNNARSSQDVKLSLDQSQINWIVSRLGVRP